MIFSLALVVIILGLFGFLLSLVFNRQDIADFFWGFYCIALAVSSLALGGAIHWMQYVVTGLVIIWGMRLCSHIFLRLTEHDEDKRYAIWRAEWMEKSAAYFYIRSLGQVFLLQGFLAMLVILPVILFNLSSDVVFSPIMILGGAVWLFGFIFEMIADDQLSDYLAKKPRPRVLQTGLWQYSRHPNYFGEVTQWWGIWLITVTTMTGWIGILGPITITILILYVSGIPMLEAHFADSKTYQKYQSETNAFIPLRSFKKK
jgi:steroid 5-alpha reductase family enzyme